MKKERNLSDAQVSFLLRAVGVIVITEDHIIDIHRIFTSLKLRKNMLDIKMQKKKL